MPHGVIEQRTSREAQFIIFKQPPALEQAEGQGRKLGWGGGFIQNQPPVSFEKGLGIFNGVSNVPGGVEHVGRYENVEPGRVVTLGYGINIDIQDAEPEKRIDGSIGFLAVPDKTL